MSKWQQCVLVLSTHFQLENWSAPAQLGSARLGTFTARARSSRKIPARTHLYCLLMYLDMTMISYSCTRGFMPNSHKKSLMVCSVSVLFRLQLEEPITNAVWHGLGSAQCPCSLLPVRKKAPLVDKFYFCGGNQPYGSVGYNGFEVLVDFKYPYILRDVIMGKI